MNDDDDDDDNSIEIKEQKKKKQLEKPRIVTIIGASMKLDEN